MSSSNSSSNSSSYSSSNSNSGDDNSEDIYYTGNCFAKGMACPPQMRKPTEKLCRVRDDMESCWSLEVGICTLYTIYTIYYLYYTLI